jgi:hypothetical protein
MNNMTTLPGNPPSNKDNMLADFADLIRADDSSGFDLSADEELRGLEETLLRLNSAFPRESLNEETVKRMQADFGIRRRSQVAHEQKTNHQTWLSFLFHSLGVKIAATFVVICILALLAPSLTTLGSSTSGVAGTQATPIGFLIAFGVGIIIIIILAALWPGRRK